MKVSFYFLKEKIRKENWEEKYFPIKIESEEKFIK